MRSTIIPCLIAALGNVRAAIASPSSSPNCDAGRLNLPNSTIISVEHVSKNTTIVFPDLVDSCKNEVGPNATATNDICRIILEARSSPTSSIRIEAWLPDVWNSRFLATGNGGIGGCIDYSSMQNGAQLGFAALGTNGGHDGSTGWDFFLNKPEVINDFGHRAIHVEAEIGKQLIAQYYDSEISKSYYQGCSTGGRQGIQTASLYPEDFDGILVGAPAVDWLRIVASKAILAERIGWPNLNSSAYVRPEQWSAIVAKQIELFDPLDGVTDGIIDDPTKFRFDAAVLACGTGALNSSVCLTAKQVESVNKAYQPLVENGEITYPAFEIGSNTGVFSSNQVDGKPQLTYRVLDDFWKGAVYNDSTWTSALNFTSSSLQKALSINPGGIAFNSRNLSTYHSLGSKVLAFHGRNDQTITSALASEYFNGVQAELDLSLDEMQDFYRLFFVPGMLHCSGGKGAWNIGQKYPMGEDLLDAKYNALVALTEWVEGGKAPESVVGTKFEGDDVKGKVLAQRKHCPYPYVSKWNGETDSNLKSSWECVSAL